MTTLPLGPLTAEEDHSVDYGRFDIRDADGTRIGSIINPYCDEEQALDYWVDVDCPMAAYARLFACSPELADALEQAALELEEASKIIRGHSRLPSTADIFLRASEKAAAVAEKARTVP